MATPKQAAYVRSLRDEIAAHNANQIYVTTNALAHRASDQVRKSTGSAIEALYYRDHMDWRPYNVADDVEATRAAIVARREELVSMTDQQIEALDGATISRLITEAKNFVH